MALKEYHPLGESSDSASRESLTTPTVTITDTDAPHPPTDSDPAPTDVFLDDESRYYIAVEEARTSAHVLAACRLHEAVVVFGEAVGKVVTRWTGLSPQDAALAAESYEIPECNIWLTADAALKNWTLEEMQRLRAMMLQKMLRTVQLLETGMATMILMALNVREEAVRHGLRLDLSVTAASTEADVALFLEEVAKSDTDDIRALEQSIREMNEPVRETRKWVRQDAARAAARSRRYVCTPSLGLDRYLRREIPDGLRGAAVIAYSASRAIDTEAARSRSYWAVASQTLADKWPTRGPHDRMIRKLVAEPIEATATHMVSAVDLAIDVVWWQTPRRGVVKWLAMKASGGTMGRRPEDDDEADLLVAAEAVNTALRASQAANYVHVPPPKESEIYPYV